MMKKSLLIGIVPIIAILLGACTKEKLTGEGSIITENRTLLVLGGLKTVKVKGSTDVYVTQGDEYKLEVKGYGNLVAALSTDVKNNVLVLEFPNHYNVRNDNTEIFLTIPHLPNLSINGSADADVSGNFPDQPDLFFHVNGSAKINAGLINVENLDVKINGSGNLNVSNVMAENAHISISGSGKVKATVSDYLKASISGSGEISYSGDAVVETQISGSGKVAKL
ncbi:MAG TPA: head GIN domain-containing protein [Pelobium sp.]|nr:head GIN domain-containing protein [Pelobium sp.]